MSPSTRLLSFLASAIVAAGCGGGGSYCDAVCDCNYCSDRDYDICLDDYDYEADYADRRDCAPEYDDYVACVEDYGTCHDGHYGCGREWDRYHHCAY